ncbi:MAG: hypothetical protein KBS60_03195 [Phascolarctobacterium sp.]|nr:hypothetical protein [Candidatus Phascolarctobacterium caballi]
MADNERTFTQEEVDSIVGARLARERAGMPTTEELNAFRAWQNGESRRESEELTATKATLATAQADLEAANKELNKVKQESYLTGKGIAKEDIDYYGFKINAMVTDKKTFEQAADEFIEAHPAKTVSVDFGGNLGGGASKDSPNNAMNALLRRAVKG